MLEGHWLDRAVGRFLGRSTLFKDGWGDAEILDALAKPVPTEEAPSPIDIVWDAPQSFGGVVRKSGSFLSPASELLADEATKRARIELLAPASSMRALCLHLSSSGEEGFMRRRTFALPLVRRGIGALILENPFYGKRRPKGQRAYFVRSVAEQLAMNRATVREARALLTAFRNDGVEKLAVSGYSMGGFMSALTATRCPFPVAAIPCAAGLSPAPVFVEGALSHSIDWGVLSRDAGDGAAAARARLAEILHAVADYLVNAPKPKSAILVAAKDDGFVRARDVEALARAWPDAEVRWLEGGHVSAYLAHRSVMRHAIIDAIERL